jgi:glyoxylase-like metal-dependent hydrolase (beta-lactamase superfamily II)
MSNITPEELGDRLFDDDDPPLVVDVRHPEEFADWHVPDSENVDVYDELTDDPGAAHDALSGLPDDRTIVTVCAAGVLSERATEHLREMGYDARTLVDGMAGWSRLHRHAPVEADLEGTLLQVARPGKGCLSYVLVSGGEAAVFDPSRYPTEYEDLLAAHEADLVGVYETHAHADHLSGGRTLADRNGVPYHLHPADATGVDATPLTDGDRFRVGAVEVEVLHTPGHSPGGVTYAVGDDALLTGDTLFHESVGRVELGVETGLDDATAAENAATLHESLRRLAGREAEPLVLPAHDPGTPEPPVAARMDEVERRNEDLGRDRESFVADLAEDLPDHPPNFERVKRVNVGAESVDDEDAAALELGPNNCAAE